MVQTLGITLDPIRESGGGEREYSAIGEEWSAGSEDDVVGVD